MQVLGTGVRVPGLVPALAVAILLSTGLLAACTGGDTSPPAAAGSQPEARNPLLDRTVRSLDEASSVHFSIAGVDVPQETGATRLLKGSGVLTRPTPASTACRGTMVMVVNNRRTVVRLISYRNTFYVELPGAAQYQVVDPVSFGLIDPASLITEKTGLQLLVDGLKSVQDKGVQEEDGVRLHTLQGQVTGLLARRVLPISDPYKPVELSLTIDERTSRPRRATITGFFFPAATPTTYVLSFSRWNERVAIRAPAT